MKAALHGRQTSVGHERIHCVHALSVNHSRECQAGQPWLIVNKYGTRAALAAIAPRFRSGKADGFPQIIQQQQILRNRIAASAAIERKLKNTRHAGP